MDGNAPFANADLAIFARLADPCVVTRGAADPVATRCIVDDGVEQIGQYGKVISRVTTVSFIKSEWSPQRGDQVSIDGTIRAIEAIDSDDGLVVKAVLHG